MRLWRLFDHQTPWARQPNFDPLDGSGGLFTASRLNPVGTRMVYLATSASLCVLETLVHVNPTEFGERTLLELEFSEDVTLEKVSPEQFIALLRDASPGQLERQTQEYGARWVREGRSALLQVPSVVLPLEHNVLLNPELLSSSETKIVRREIVNLDARLRR